MKSHSLWRYGLGRILHFAFVYALLVFVYSVILNGQLEVTVHSTLAWDVGQAVQAAAGAGEIGPDEVDEYRAELLHQAERAYGFDRPFLIRAGKLFLKTARLDFGHSLGQRVTHTTGTTQDTLVIHIIAEALLSTLLLFGSAFLFQALLALILGLRNGSKPGSAGDRVTTSLSILLAGIPPFVLAMFMVNIFVFRIPLAPSDPLVSTFPSTWSQVGPWAREFFSHVALPFFTLVFANIWATAHCVRNLSLNVFSEDYVRAARARGLPERRTIYGIGRRATAAPTLTLLATGFATSLWGGFLVEPIFQWPGIGCLFLRCTNAADIPMVMGMLVVITGIYLFGLMVLDLSYGLMDPRIKVGNRAAR